MIEQYFCCLINARSIAVDCKQLAQGQTSARVSPAASDPQRFHDTTRPLLLCVLFLEHFAHQTRRTSQNPGTKHVKMLQWTYCNT